MSPLFAALIAAFIVGYVPGTFINIEFELLGGAGVSEFEFILLFSVILFNGTISSD